MCMILLKFKKKYKNDHLKTIKEEYESKFDDSRKINDDEMNV